MKHFLYIFLYILIFNGVNFSFSQNDTAQFSNKNISKNNFSFELGGKAIYGSIGYERTIFTNKNTILAASLQFISDFSEAMALPIGIKYIAGRKKNKLLFGLYGTNYFDFTPYPKTKSERQIYISSGQAEYGKYEPPYRLIFIMPSIGYRRYFKKGNSLSIEYLYLIYRTPIGKYIFSSPSTSIPFPWFGLQYNLRF